MTDGQANVGVTEPERLVGLCRTARAAGITTSTIGFGADYDEHLLRQMADAGGGSAYYIERPDQAPGVFAEELEGLLSIAAQNVAVTIAPSAAVQLVGVHHRYPTTETAEGLRVDLGDLYAREPKALLLEFFVPSLGTSAEPVAIGTVSVLAYVLSEDGGLARQEVTFPIAAPLDLAGKQEPEVRREMLLLEAAKAREAALEARARGDYAAGSDALAAVAPMLAHLAADDAVLREEMADLEAMAGQFAAREVSAADAKYLGQRAYNAHRKKEAYGEKLSRRNRPTET
jgi:Ca-activated chloride channel family protein